MAEYISREAALDCFACDLGKKDYSVSYQGFMTEAAFRINDLPAADVRPVVRGKWNETKTGFHCSACKSKAKGTKAGALLSNFCPNCGADMREES